MINVKYFTSHCKDSLDVNILLFEAKRRRNHQIYSIQSGQDAKDSSLRAKGVTAPLCAFVSPFHPCIVGHFFLTEEAVCIPEECYVFKYMVLLTLQSNSSKLTLHFLRISTQIQILCGTLFILCEGVDSDLIKQYFDDDVI